MFRTSSTDPPAAPEDISSPRRRGLVVTLTFLIVAVVFAWPLPRQLTTHLLATGTDPELLMWALGWNAHAFLHQPFAIFDANIFHPSRHALAYSENMIGSSILVAPIIWATGDLVLAMNLVQLSSVVISALGAYLLARRLGLGVPAALLTGLIFGFAPARFFRMSQAHLTTIQWMPFCLAYLHTYLSAGGRPRDLKLAALFFTAQALTSGHGAVFLTVAALALMVWRTLLGAPLEPSRRLRDLGVAGGLLLLPAVLLLLPYRGARAEVPNLTRGLDHYASSLSSYVSSPTPVHQWLLGLAPAWLTAEPPDAHLFIGVVPVLLAIVAAVVFIRTRGNGRQDATGPRQSVFAWREDPVPFYAALALLSFWFTLGPPIGLWQWTYQLPVFTFLRVPSRFVLLEVLAVAVLAGFGAQWLTRRVARLPAHLVPALLGVLLLVEFVPVSMVTVPYAVETTAADRFLAGRPGPVVVAEVPVSGSRSIVTRARRNTLYMLHSTAHWQKIVHGYSGAEPEHYTMLHGHLVRFPDDASLEALAARGVTHVVMHPYLYQESELADAEARFARYRDWLRLEYVSPQGRVYSLRRPAGE